LLELDWLPDEELDWLLDEELDLLPDDELDWLPDEEDSDDFVADDLLLSLEADFPP